MTGKKTGGCLLLIVVAVALSWGVYECKYYYSKWSDHRNSPWAYSDDADTNLLVGRWEGTFSDPDKILKNIQLEIFVPMTDAEREAKASRRWKRASYSSRNKNRFDGAVTVTSKLGTEPYEIVGHVEKSDIHKLHFSFRSVDETKRVLPNFALVEAKNGNWDADQLTITLAFAYRRADGSSFSSSADPRHSKEVTATLRRVKAGQ